MEECWSDWEDEDEEEAARRARASAPAPGLDPAGGGPGGVQWVVMGRPGPQKHAHAARLAEVLAVPYISMGTLVRQELSPASHLYRKVGNVRSDLRLLRLSARRFTRPAIPPAPSLPAPQSLRS